MSYKITSWAWRQGELPQTAKFVLLALADYADENGTCWPSIPKLAEKIGLSRTSTKSVTAGLRVLEARGLVSKKGRVRAGSNAQTSYEFTIHFKGSGLIARGVEAENPDPQGGEPYEPVSEPITEPITSPTPSPLRGDAEKEQIPCAVNVPSTAHESPSEEEARELVQTSQLRAELRALISIEDVDDWTAASDDFLETFEDIYRDRIRDDAGDLYWNRGFSDRLDQIIRAESKTRDREDAISYGIAKWLSIFTNTALDITR